VPAKSVRELIALTKKQPGTLNYPSAGKGTNSHLSMELFRSLTGINIVHVPYRGGAPAQMATVAGEMDLGFNNIVAAVPLVRAGRLRALGISSSRRAAVLPELPTIAEAGVPGYEFTTWYGVLAPAGTPIDVINVLHDHIVKAVRAPDLAQRFANEGAEVIASPPAQLASHIKAELARWAKVVKESEGLRAD
jgi:tripartite-type tricarboxylate transporter receptor subunit TctC